METMTRFSDGRGNLKIYLSHVEQKREVAVDSVILLKFGSSLNSLPGGAQLR
jgi:hypothetical protein